MYAYPGYVTPRLIETMASHKQILHYLDIPLQHGHRDTLLRMKRPAKIEWVYETLANMRAAMPDLAVRTTFIVGYPGETDAEFDGLLKFVKDLEFDRVGAFKYSYEIGTPSATAAGSGGGRRQRGALRSADGTPARHQPQEEPALDRQDARRSGRGAWRRRRRGRQPDRDSLSLGRSYRDAPEIDGYVIVEGELPVGEIVPVRVTGATTYDLIATVDTGRRLSSSRGRSTARGCSTNLTPQPPLRRARGRKTNLRLSLRRSNC